MFFTVSMWTGITELQWIDKQSRYSLFIVFSAEACLHNEYSMICTGICRVDIEIEYAEGSVHEI